MLLYLTSFGDYILNTELAVRRFNVPTSVVGRSHLKGKPISSYSLFLKDATFGRDRIFGIGFSMIPSTSHWIFAFLFAKSPIVQLGLFVNSNLMLNGWITHLCLGLLIPRIAGKTTRGRSHGSPIPWPSQEKPDEQWPKSLQTSAYMRLYYPVLLGDWLFHKAMTSFRILVPAEAISISWNDCQNGQMITYKICLRHFTHSWIRSKRTTELSQGSVFSSGHDFGDFDANLGTVTWTQCFFLWPTTCFSGV